MTAKFRKQLESILERHINLGVESIFTSVYSGPTIQTLSFTHILNRVMMLVQLPITFVIMKLETNGDYKEQFRTNHHKRHQDAIGAASKTSDPRHYFPLWHGTEEGDKFYLLVLKADKSYEFKQLLVVDGINDSMNSWDIGSYKLLSIFQRDRYAHYDGFADKIISVIKNTKSNLDRSDEGHSVSDLPEINEKVKSKFDRNLLSNISELYKNLNKRGVIDRVFGKIAQNISDVNSQDKSEGGHLTNFIMFARDYYKTPSHQWRHDSYDYSLRILLCDTQREEVKSFLQNMRQHKAEKRSRYLEELKTVVSPEAKKISKEIDDYFWQILETGEEGCDRLIDVLGGYFGNHSRSMADPVFDGLSFYRQPFANDGGVARCFSPGIELPDGISSLPPGSEINDLLRVALCEYMFDEMAAGAALEESSALQLQVMLNPVEVGGRVWGVVAYATRSHNPEIKLNSIQDLVLYDSYWSKNYHIYRDVNERMKKNLRSYMNAYYEQFVANIYDAWIRGMKRIDKSKPGATLKQLQELLNMKLRSLSCIFPYDVVQVELRRIPAELLPVPSSVAQDGERRALAASHWAAYVTVSPQSRFPVAPGVQLGATVGFVDATDVAVAMTDRLFRGAVDSPDQQHEHND